MTHAVIDAIRKRRSTRAYKPIPVSREVIEMLIEAGSLAPSREGHPTRDVRRHDGPV